MQENCTPYPWVGLSPLDEFFTVIASCALICSRARLRHGVQVFLQTTCHAASSVGCAATWKVMAFACCISFQTVPKAQLQASS